MNKKQMKSQAKKSSKNLRVRTSIRSGASCGSCAGKRGDALTACIDGCTP